MKMNDEKDFEHEVIDRLKSLENDDFNWDTVNASYVESILKAKDEVLKLIEKQEKVIDYMVDRIEWLMKSNGIALDFEHKDNFTKEDIKDAFYRKVENNE